MRHCFRIPYHVFDLLPRHCEGAPLYGNKGLGHTYFAKSFEPYLLHSREIQGSNIGQKLRFPF
jgi:hypothetical protein